MENNVKNEQMKNQIDKMDYESMLRRWRNAPVGDPFFQGDIGDYYSKVMAKKRSEIGNAVHVAISKKIGQGGIMKIVDYRICVARSTTDIENEVLEYIKGKWKPQGGICIEVSYNVARFYQAMIKEESTDEKN